MPLNESHSHHITNEEIEEAWQKSIEDPSKDWRELVADEPLLAEELEIITGANATHNGCLDVAEKSRELRVAAFVYGLLKNSHRQVQ